MSFRKCLKNIIIPICLLLIINACKDGEEPSFLMGEWNIDTYEIYYEENGEVITDLRYEDAGEFILKEGGIGNATIATPGSSLPENQSITWFYDDGDEEITIDYNTMESPFIYKVEIASLSELQWITNKAGPITTISLTRK